MKNSTEHTTNYQQLKVFQIVNKQLIFDLNHMK